ncbi:hypothetical protein [Streptomyces mexicanus]|uniref:hypothetical protein n=1 Tax=Streptomyces mexicanus TaxID=178566 RepID=UPI001914E48B|nr:hypothetical protein [Streptomyces mexicanus]
MTRPHPVTADRDAHLRLGRHLLAVVRAQDAAIPAHPRVPRTVAATRARLQERMAQTVTMADDACPLSGRWNCTGTDCPPSSVTAPTPDAAPVPAAATAGGQCSVCGGWFEGWSGGVCDACR